MEIKEMIESKYSTWHHPYKPAKEYNKKAAYFSMEFGIDAEYDWCGNALEIRVLRPGS